MTPETGSVERPGRVLPLLRRAAMVAGILFLVALALQIDLSELWATLSRVSFGLVGLGFAILLVPPVLRAWRFRVTLATRLPLSDLFYVTLVHTLARETLPFGLGEAFYPSFLKLQRGVPLAESVGSLAFSHLLDSAALAVFFLVAVSNVTAELPQLARVAWIVNAALIALGVGAAAAWLLRGRLSALWGGIRDRLESAGGRWRDTAVRLDRSLAAVGAIATPRVVLLSAGITIPLWIVTIAGTGIVYEGMGLQLRPWDLVLLVSVMYFFGFLPIHTVGGLGTLDSLWVILVMAFGVGQGPALSFTILRRAISTVFSLLTGAVGLSRLGLKVDWWRPWRGAGAGEKRP